MKEGITKFKELWIEGPLIKTNISKINKWRSRLYSTGLIGRDSGNMGYGNISEKKTIGYRNDYFIITGSQTGKFSKLTKEHYTKIVRWDIEKNELISIGPIRASSESLTHAAVYESSKKVRGVIHVHHKELWEKFIDVFPTTSRKVKYGTPEMAYEIKKIFSKAEKNGIIIMGGHKNGILSFGKTLDEAGKTLLSYLKD